MSKTFNKYMGSILDSLDATKHIKAGLDFNRFINLMTRPIGILSKNYGFVIDTLYRNIGDNVHEYDGYGTPIGGLADTEFNYYSKTPWFYIDEKKNTTTNYIEYVNKNYFLNSGLYNNESINDNMLLSNNVVGAVRDYNLLDTNSLYTNPNGYDDTKLGEVNTIFLDATLKNANNTYEERKNNSITDNIYSNFGLWGRYGMQNGFTSSISNKVRTQKELLGDIIPWSTTDHTYDSYTVRGGDSGNISMVKSIFNLGEEENISLLYTDDAKQKGIDNLYYPFGNFYSNTYSLGLLSSTNSKTKEFIAKSMLGYDLLGNDDVDLEMKNIDKYAPKKYYVGNGTRGSNYVDKLSGIDVKFIKYEREDGSGEDVVRMEFPDMGNDSLWSSRALYTYTEAEGNTVPTDAQNIFETFNEGVEYGRHVGYNLSITSEKKDIVHYTNRMFQSGQYKTLVSRFHTDEIGLDGSRGNRDITSTAVSKYGMSHGRNLLKLKPTDSKGYNNPYCRTWTYHHQYHSLEDVIRPFNYSREEIKNSAIDLNRTVSGTDKLFDYGVKMKNGLVRITPTSDETEDTTRGVKRCMFSIENLAWKGEKDFFVGHEDQKGPLGGRIMWFPPYDLKFSENVNVAWSQNQFIGRGESIYTYTNTERGGQLSFKLLIDHPSVVNQWRGDIRGGDAIGDVDDVGSNEQGLLRFFAGCELLAVAKPEEKQKPKEKVIEVKQKDVEVPPTTTDTLVFYVFYPNNYSGVDDDASGIVKPMEYLVNGIGPNKYIHTALNTKKETIEDYGTTLDTPLDTTLIGGYEMGNGGISKIEAEDHSSYSGTCVELVKQGDVRIAYQYYNPNKAGKRNYWAYRCDKAYQNQVLHTHNGNPTYNYYDVKDYSLNSDGFASLLQVHTNDTEVFNNGRLFSFTDVFCALQPEAKEKALKDKYDENSVNIISSILGINKKGYSIKRINVQGFASSHGYKNSNNTLGRNRAKSVVNWLKKCNPDLFSVDYNYEDNEIGSKLPNYDSSSFLAKVWRCTRVELVIEKETIIEQSEVIDVPKTQGYDNITWADNKVHREIIKSRGVAELTKALSKIDLKHNYNNILGKDLTDIQEQATVNQIENNKSDAEAEAMAAKGNGNAYNITSKGKQGYGKEYEFFSMLSTESPFLHSKIVEKLKYFDPAFHSITPEGFQSRLTFLHQCTRQGNTAAASDTNNKNRTANNLAFGRPPVCVLRIGDFYNTKIIIDSLSIDYDDTTWDLNDEGIGVMPMMANVNISFKFLGGSDLSGPINRLQNALSFNHYANTSIYDDRAEEIEYDNEGNIIKFNFNPK